MFAEGRFHMFVSYITGIPEQWAGHERHILHHVSDDLVTWEYRGIVPLSSDYVIDACVAPTPDGYRMWFKDEAADSTTWCADSTDLETWGPSRPVIEGRPHEGPNVFTLGGWHWMIVDEWRGQAVYRSDDLEHWTADGRILVEPRGHHADVVATDAPRPGSSTSRTTCHRSVRPARARTRPREAPSCAWPKPAWSTATWCATPTNLLT